MTPKLFKSVSWLTILYLLPVLATLAFIHRFGVNVPFMDSFSLVGLFHKIALDTATLGDFWVPHNEHRMLVPRIFIAALAFATNWNVKVQQYFSVLLSILSAIALYWISRQQALKNQNTHNWQHFADIITVILLFSLIQYENWLWGFQLAWFWKTTCLVFAIALLQYPPKHRSLDRGFLLGAIFALLMSFSGAHGLLVWVALFPLIWVRSQASEQPQMQRVLWILLCVGSVVLYASGYQEPADNLDRTYVLKHPFEAISFFLVILGRNFSTEPKSAIAPGIMILLGCAVGFFLFWKQHHHRAELAAWLPLLLFPLGFAAMTTVGRTVLGIHAASASRYTTVTVLMLIGLLHIARICCQRQPWRLLYGGMAVVFAVFSISISFDALEAGKNSYQDRTLGKHCLALIEYLEPSPSDCILKIFPDPNPVKNLWYPQLKQIEFFEFVQEAEFSQIPPKPYGLIDNIDPGDVVTLTPDSVLSLSGWSVFPGRPEVPEIVLFSQDDRPAFFAAALVNQASPDLVEVFKMPEYDRARWQVSLPSGAFPEGITSIRAWIFDGNQTFIPLENVVQVSR
ncbi:MAG: Poxvirus protein I5 [Phormidium sp. OSCR]|nr:MAG: Poxvirus protein I5 [Phormidium sp. OSCR]